MYNSPSPSPIIEFITHHSPSIQRLFISLSSRFPFPPPHLHLLLLYLCNSHRRYLVSWSIITLLLLADLLHECYDFLIAHYSILLLLSSNYPPSAESSNCVPCCCWSQYARVPESLYFPQLISWRIYYLPSLQRHHLDQFQCDYYYSSHVSLLHSRHCLFILRHHRFQFALVIHKFHDDR